MEWGGEYEKCPVWFRMWKDAHTPDADWPKGIKILEGRMYFGDKLCIPYSLQGAWIRDYHAFVGHVGLDRLWYQLHPRVEFADEEEAKKFVNHVMGQCETCQAMQRAHRLAGPMEPTPVPPRVMTHVALDLFKMPTVQEE